MSEKQVAIRTVTKDALNLYVMYAYRQIIWFLFLFVSFRQFPEHRLPIALGAILISQYLFSVNGAVSHKIGLVMLSIGEDNEKIYYSISAAQKAGLEGRPFEVSAILKEYGNEDIRQQLLELASIRPKLKDTGTLVVGFIKRALIDIIGVSVIYFLT